MQARKTVQGKIVEKKIVCRTDEQIKLVQKLVKENCSSEPIRAREPIRAHWCTAHFLVNFSWLGVHTNSFPGLKAVTTSF